MTVYLQDVTEGDGFTSRGRTITEADIVSFAGLSGDFNPLHTDETWVTQNTEFRGRIAHGLLVLAVSSGLGTPGVDDLEVLAYMEVTRRMAAPVYPGDTIRVRYVVSEARGSRSRPDRGVVTLGVEVVNQHDEVVQTGTDVLLVGADPGRLEAEAAS
jgi:acyl dehydratase